MANGVKHLHQLAHIPRPSDPMGGVRVQPLSQSRDQCVYKQVIKAPDSAGACLRRLILTLEKMNGTQSHTAWIVTAGPW